jgi:hypothetical protein
MSRPGPAQYSGTPLPKKLGIREGSRVRVVGAPEGFTLAPTPSGVEVHARARAPLDVVVLFTRRRAELATVQRVGLDAGLVDNKSASIDDVFQGLQFVVRLADRPRS